MNPPVAYLLCEISENPQGNPDSSAPFCPKMQTSSTLKTTYEALSTFAHLSLTDWPNNQDGRIPLHWAATTSNLGLTQLLLGYHPELDSKDAVGWTPLMVACAFLNNPFSCPIIKLIFVSQRRRVS